MFPYFTDRKQITENAGRASVSGLVIDLVTVVLTACKSTDGPYFMFNKIPHFKHKFIELLLPESFINTLNPCVNFLDRFLLKNNAHVSYC